MKIKPFLKWAGGKYRCLEFILNALPKANRLLEPFTGSGVVFLNTHYPQYLLAEGNPDLINLFEQIQQHGLPFIDYCESFFSKANNQSAQYYTLRDTFNHCTRRKQRAAIFLYLNRHGYNGLCRYNQSGGYNVPFGRYIKPYFPRKELIAFHCKSQQHTTFLRADFQTTFARAKPGDIVYCDPPYAPLKQTSNFSSYINRPFGEQEQRLLTHLARHTASRGVVVIISNHDTAFTREQYEGSQITSFAVKRSINCKGHERRIVNELIAVFHAP